MDSVLSLIAAIVVHRCLNAKQGDKATDLRSMIAPMVSADDWRLLNAERLSGQEFRWKTYTTRRPDWDHEHCAGCWAKFAEFEGPSVLHEGYAVTERYEKGADYEWVCHSCFDALKDQHTGPS